MSLSSTASIRSPPDEDGGGSVEEMTSVGNWTCGSVGCRMEKAGD